MCIRDSGAMFVLDLYEVARDMWLTIRSKDVMELPEENADPVSYTHLDVYKRQAERMSAMQKTPEDRNCLACAFPFWAQLTADEQEMLCRYTRPVHYCCLLYTSPCCCGARQPLPARSLTRLPTPVRCTAPSSRCCRRSSPLCWP